MYGDCKIEGHFVNDKQIAQIVSKNGIITQKCEMQDGIPLGLVEVFYLNGNIKSRATITPNGEKINMQNFDENGNLIGN